MSKYLAELLLLVFLLCVAFLLELGSAWKLMLIGWMALVLFLRHTKRDENFSPQQQRVFSVLWWLFPVLVTGVEYMVDANVIAHSWRYLNILEHGILMTAFAFSFYGLLAPYLKKLPKIVAIAFLFASLMTFGLGIEILQYLWRDILLSPTTAKMAA